MTAAAFKSLALSFPGTEERPHFDRTAFNVMNRRIFATLHEAGHSANILLSPAGHSDFCGLGIPAVYPVPNKWGEKGWTTFELSDLPEDVVLAALELAYKKVLNDQKKP